MKRSGFVELISAAMSLAPSGLAPTASAAPASSTSKRAQQAYDRRVAAAAAQRSKTATEQRANGDEQRYASQRYVGSFTKGLPHDDDGYVDPQAYQDLLRAIGGSTHDVDKISSRLVRSIVASANENAFDLEGSDPEAVASPIPPALASPRLSAEAVELYWQAVTRDVPFIAYDSDPTIAIAAADMARFSDIEAARPAPHTIFRGPASTLVGPYMSQFALQDVPYGYLADVPQRLELARPGVDYLTDRAAFLHAQNGGRPLKVFARDEDRRYIYSGRTLADYTWQLRSIEMWVIAASIVGAMGPRAYDRDLFSPTEIIGLVGRVGTITSAAILFQKLFVHRRVRPEAVGGLVDNARLGKPCPLDASFFHSNVLAHVERKYGTHFLPQAFPEGSPPHPAYPSGHATLAGAGATILKAHVNESFVIDEPVMANADGTKLVPYNDRVPLTVGHELDKLASNCAFGRGSGSIHWRSDSLAGLRFGEAFAIGLLRDRANVAGRSFKGYHLTTFDGATVDILSEV